MKKDQPERNYEAIYTMSKTDGWKEIDSLLKYDEVFFKSILCKPKPKAEGGKPIWDTADHDIGVARGILLEIDKINRIIKKANNLFGPKEIR